MKDTCIINRYTFKVHIYLNTYSTFRGAKNNTFYIILSYVTAPFMKICYVEFPAHDRFR